MKAKEGVGVIHVTDTFKNAKRFEQEIGRLWDTLDRKAFPGKPYLRMGEVVFSSDDFIKPVAGQKA